MTTGPAAPSAAPSAALSRSRDLLVLLGLFNLYFIPFFFRSPALPVKLLPAAEYLWLALMLFGLRRQPRLGWLAWPTIALFLGPLWWALARGWGG